MKASTSGVASSPPRTRTATYASEIRAASGFENTRFSSPRQAGQGGFFCVTTTNRSFPLSRPFAAPAASPSTQRIARDGSSAGGVPRPGSAGAVRGGGGGGGGSAFATAGSETREATTPAARRNGRERLGTQGSGHR